MIYVLDEALRDNRATDLYFRCDGIDYRTPSGGKASLYSTCGICVKNLFKKHPKVTLLTKHWSSKASNLRVQDKEKWDALPELLTTNKYDHNPIVLESTNLWLLANNAYSIQKEDGKGHEIVYWAPLAINTETLTISAVLISAYQDIDIRIWRGPLLVFFEMVFPVATAIGTAMCLKGKVCPLLHIDSETGKSIFHAIYPKEYKEPLSIDQEFAEHTLGKLKDTVLGFTDEELADNAESSLLFMDDQMQDLYKRALTYKHIVPYVERDTNGKIISYTSQYGEEQETLTENAVHSLAPDVILQLDETYRPARISSRSVFDEEQTAEVWLITGLDSLLDNVLSEKANFFEDKGKKCEALIESALQASPYCAVVLNFLISTSIFSDCSPLLSKLLLAVNDDKDVRFDLGESSVRHKEYLTITGQRPRSRAYLTFFYRHMEANFGKLVPALMSGMDKVDSYRGKKVVFDILDMTEDSDDVTEVLLGWYTTVRVSLWAYKEVIDYTDKHDKDKGKQYEFNATGSAYNYLEGIELGPYIIGRSKFNNKEDSRMESWKLIVGGMKMLRNEIKKFEDNQV